jgi:cytosine/adenosine deaminase-related metal-dependent hydrolase
MAELSARAFMHLSAEPLRDFNPEGSWLVGVLRRRCSCSRRNIDVTCDVKHIVKIQLLAAAGIAPLDVIRIATYNSAVFLGKADQLGSVDTGKLADLVLLSKDPTARCGPQG